ncbi:MAG: hypothetical protein Q4P71_09355 [Actinomycetaceae bacterium]|nr:hypothetical protein [Actinomycetaceae bacterium]
MNLRRLILLTVVAALTLAVAIVTAFGFPPGTREAGAVRPSNRATTETPSPTADTPTRTNLSQPTNPPTKKRAPVTRSPEEIDKVRTVLERAPEDPSQVLAESVVELYGVDLSDVFPPGTTIEVDIDTWTDIDENTALVATQITRPGHLPERYSAVLGKTNGKWMLLGTLPLEETQSTSRGPQ